MTLRTSHLLMLAAVACVGAGCFSADDDDRAGGAGTGTSAGAGQGKAGATSSGGKAGQGGAGATSGGKAGQGGAGATSSGGKAGQGGAGATSSGGKAGQGGAGATSSGGKAGQGGAGSAGSPAGAGGVGGPAAPGGAGGETGSSGQAGGAGEAAGGGMDGGTGGAGTSGSSGSTGGSGGGWQPPPGGGLDPVPFGGGRPASLFVPEGYQSNQPAPLLLMLHGYGFDHELEEAYLGVTPVAAQKGMLYMHPSGTLDLESKPFWNATDACCNLYQSQVDDVGYLAGLIEEIKGRYAVDPKRVFLLGHSNGGFMAHRMACERADLITGIVSLAGATFASAAACQPSAPVSVVQVHGTADDTVLYDGGTNYPGAIETASRWAALNGCELGSIIDSIIDLDNGIPGADTATVQAGPACAAQSAVELWAIQGGVHIPSVTGTLAQAATDFLLAHPRP